MSVIVLYELSDLSAVSGERRPRPNEVALQFGENLRRLRRRKGLSQEELAIRASLHRTEIGMLENGLRVARITTLLQLSGALEVEPGELMAGIDWTPGGVLGGAFGLKPPPPRGVD